MVFAVSAVLKRRTARSNTSQNFRPITALAVGALCCVYVVREHTQPSVREMGKHPVVFNTKRCLSITPSNFESHSCIKQIDGC